MIGEGVAVDEQQVHGLLLGPNDSTRSGDTMAPTLSPSMARRARARKSTAGSPEGHTMAKSTPIATTSTARIAEEVA
jgi:hypothetical protein